MLTKLALAAGTALLAGACTSQNGEDLLATGPAPVPACDTTHVTYAGTVGPLLLQRCTSCHGGSQPAARISLTTYAQVRSVAVSGSLLGTIDHAPGYSAMPKGGAQLSDCDRAKLHQWVAAGSPNN